MTINVVIIAIFVVSPVVLYLNTPLTIHLGLPNQSDIAVKRPYDFVNAAKVYKTGVERLEKAGLLAGWANPWLKRQPLESVGRELRFIRDSLQILAARFPDSLTANQDTSQYFAKNVEPILTKAEQFYSQSIGRRLMYTDNRWWTLAFAASLFWIVLMVIKISREEI